MLNTSATGGFLIPYENPLYGDELQNFLHETWHGITGLEKNQIRPMWQEIDPLMVNKEIPCWMFWGIVGITVESDSYQKESQDGTHIEFTRPEIIQLVATFQGRQAMNYATLFRDGLKINQNMDELQRMGMLVQEIGEFEYDPSLYNTLWYAKCSLGFTISRGIRRKYRILSLLEADTKTTVSEY